MKRVYNFYAENGELTCQIKNANEVVEYTGKDAVKRLRRIDSLYYEKVRFNNNNLKLIGKSIFVIIRNIEEFNKNNNLNRHLTKTLPLVKLAVYKYQLDKVKDFVVTNEPLYTKSAIVSFMTVSMLLNGANVTNIKSIYDIAASNNTIEQSEDEINKSAVDESIQMEDLNITFDDNSIETETNDVVQDNDQPVQEEEPIAIETENIDQITTNEKEYNGIITNDITLDIQNISDCETAVNVQNEYRELIEKYSSKWGISPNLATAILTQESAGKSSNLMQIEFNAWKDTPITVYNHESKKYETICLTNNSSKYKDTICISENDLKNDLTNISVGNAMLAYNMNHFKYNIPVAITAYNYGVNATNKVLNATSQMTGISKDSLLNDSSNLKFLDYRYIMGSNYGDSKYFENVIRYLPNFEDGINILDPDNTLHTLNVSYEPVKEKQH